MHGERILRTMILAAVGLALFGFFKPESTDPIEDSATKKSWFFINKVHQDAEYDVVIVGDSRALRAVSAQTVGEQLGGLRVYNFAFHAGGMNHEMFLEAENLLDDQSRNRAVILAPTSLAFLPRKSGNAQFHEYRNKPRDQVWIYRNFPEIAHWFQPVVPSIYLRRLLGVRPPKLLYQEFHAGGWIETDQEPRDDLSDLTVFSGPLEGERADEEAVAGFADQTREWTERGITVFAFYPPAYEPRVAQEDSMLGFDRESFTAAFRSAGGIWLDMDRNGYRTYDGSHLESASALKLSRDLSRAMAPFIGN